MSDEKPHDHQLEHAISNHDIKNPDVLEIEAKEALATEHALTTAQAVRAYPMAIFWCLMVSMCVIMEGYDTIL
jgi:SP family general alpha glucoside:H+ symporter-like MFS transporter